MRFDDEAQDGRTLVGGYGDSGGKRAQGVVEHQGVNRYDAA